MKLKVIGLALLSAMALLAFTAASADATVLEVGGVKQTGKVAIKGSLTAAGIVLVRTDGTLANTCTVSVLAGETETNLTTEPIGKLSSLTFESCTRPVTLHLIGKFKFKWTSGTNGTVYFVGMEWTFGTPFGTVNCKTGEGVSIGDLTGAASGNTTVHINAVLNCGFLLPSARLVGTYTITTPQGLGVLKE
jgi:membrane protease subunit (stomatin/prohibitin family)